MSVVSRPLMFGLYVLIMVESITIGLSINLIIKISMTYGEVPPLQRSVDHVLMFSFLVMTVVGHIATLPCVCYAAQRHKAKWLVPYLTWRAFLCLLVIVLAIYLCVVFPERQTELAQREEAYKYTLPVCLAEIVIGTAFFAITFRAYKELSRNVLDQVDKMY